MATSFSPSVAQALLTAFEHSQVLIVQGPTGSGKTTQLPCLLHQHGLIHHCLGITQPRRIAAMTVAERIAESLGEPGLGGQVGYCVRFADTCSPGSLIRVMTDGILLQEARTSPLLLHYDVVMVDEAHERSLNIDFTLGLLKQIVQRRADLKIIISSATLQSQLFVDFFSECGVRLRQVDIAQRSYPLKILYRPPPRLKMVDILQSMLEQLQAWLHGHRVGHALLFFPGEAWIVAAQKHFSPLLGGKSPVVLIPLFARLTASQQRLAFATKPCKVILATNIAETSITIDQVRLVIDSGLAKTPWFNPKTGMVHLREGLISQAAAAQRAGRAGRVAPGTAIRLYPEALLQAQPLHTPEEILRSELSEVVLRLLYLRQNPRHFSLPTMPPKAAIHAALETLRGLGAIAGRRHQLSEIGERMAQFPLSPKISRMIVAAEALPASSPRQSVLEYVLHMAALLAGRSVFLPPSQVDEHASHVLRKAHKSFFSPFGDSIMALQAFLQFLHHSDPQAFCNQYYLDYEVLKFAQQILQQLRDICKRKAVAMAARNTPGKLPIQEILQCMLQSFATHVLFLQKTHYTTATGVVMFLHPSCCLFKKPPPVAMATEFFHAKRNYAVNVSKLLPEWLAGSAPKRPKRTSRRRGRRR